MGKHADAFVDNDRNRIEAALLAMVPGIETGRPVTFAELVELVDFMAHEIATRVFDTLPKFEPGGDFHDVMADAQLAYEPEPLELHSRERHLEPHGRIGFRPNHGD